METESWKNDPEYVSIISDLLESPQIQKLGDYTQHHHSTRLKHSIAVSYESYKIAKKMNLDYRAAARGGLLHDLFYYDWRTTKFDLGTHAYIHPRVALRNAKKITDITPKEQDIILKHMWGLTLARPKYMESVIVSLVDDYSAVNEFFSPMKKKARGLLKR
ncbi:HDIG domain-containing metalloprotein [Fructilactobacillus fructivorans]|uniref:HDIG domain-containing metalloprotein n=1 Tax=Fructilactobacillus fructivorans TaxID=1614 RepID=UPI000704B549|nr:HDIG domain-containing metalloprotein [Fructilactobacillus fructivorans]KRN42544.1 metal dependent phosphohydrolase [Fructilactobacillus fructivorans]